MTRIAAFVLGLAVMLTAGSAVAAPNDLSADPLDRGVLLALPSVYQLRVDVTVDALITSDGRRLALSPDARRVAEAGTAFGVAPGGYVVAAAHVATPSGESLAVLARINQLAFAGEPHDEETARRWVRANRARATGVRVLSRTLRQADAGQGADRSMSWAPRLVRADRAADLALLRIPEPAAPALALDESRTIGTPVATIGYGGGGPDADSDLEPAVRPGELGRTGTAKSRPGRRLLEVTTGVLRGDSGGPAVDADGRVHGVVVLRSARGGIVEPSSAVRRLLAEAGLTPTPKQSAGADEFGVGMKRFWALDFEEAKARFDAALRAFPNHPLAARQRDRAAALVGADVSLAPQRSRTRGFLLAFGVLAAVAAAACGIGLAAIGWDGLLRRESQRARH